MGRRMGRGLSDGRGAVGVAQHGVEGAGEVVVVGAAVILLSYGHQTRQTHDEQQQELQRQSRPQDPRQEGLAASRSSATAWAGGTTARGSARRNPGGPEDGRKGVSAHQTHLLELLLGIHHVLMQY